MRKIFLYILLLSSLSCSSPGPKAEGNIVTVSIAPFGFFVEKIGGDDFRVNVMVPEGSDPHVYEPSPAQVSALRKSSAYITDGYLDFELAWLDKFYSANRLMKNITLAGSIDLIREEGHEGHGHALPADPHFWVSPKCALRIASEVKTLLCELKPSECEKYERNYSILTDSIGKIHKRAGELFAPFAGRSFTVFHPTLSYFARDYNLVQVALEKEGKEPSPSWLKEVIDETRRNRSKLVLTQKEFDMRNAKVITSETGAQLRVINPLSGDWFSSVNGIIDAVYQSMADSTVNK